MPLAKITITIPETMWIADASTAYPDVTFRVISTQYDDGTATGLFEIEGDDVLQILARANEKNDITGMDLLWKNAEKTVVQIETDNPLLLLPVSRVGVPLKTPFVISDGVASWEVFTSHSKLSELADEFDELGIPYDLESVQEFDAVEDDAILTARQREVLSTAFEAGYYDTPREASLTEVAESLDVTKSTCSDILHRAEGKIIERYIDSQIRY
jgi:predicted DNA binding protein